MKGVTRIRVRTRPLAECQRLSCGWERGIGMQPAVTRASAMRHVLTTGHRVTVTIRDITEYSLAKTTGAPA